MRISGPAVPGRGCLRSQCRAAGPSSGWWSGSASCGLYSIESRNSATGSNVRGHVIAQVTDYARNPAAFGGQPQIVLEPGSSYTLAWDVGFHPDVDDFLEATEPPVVLDRLGAPIGDPIAIRSDRGVQEVYGTEHGVA